MKQFCCSVIYAECRLFFASVLVSSMLCVSCVSLEQFDHSQLFTVNFSTCYTVIIIWIKWKLKCSRAARLWYNVERFWEKQIKINIQLKNRYSTLSLSSVIFQKKKKKMVQERQRDLHIINFITINNSFSLIFA